MANEAPAVTTSGGSANYTEGNAAVPVDPSLSVADVDDTELESARVRITNGFQSGDELIFVDTANITGSYDTGTGVLTLTGTDTLANYQAALRSIQFSTTDDNPVTSKTLEWTVNDGDTDSAPATKEIAVTPVNDPPTAVADTAAVNEDATVTGNVIAGAADGTGQDTDPEGDSLAITAVSGPSGAGTVGQPLVGTYGTLTLSADGSYSYTANTAAAQALVAGEVVTDTFTYTVSDGTDTADAILTFTITGQDEVFFGGSDGDYVFAAGMDGDDQLSGGGGDDHLEGGTGNDRLFGEDGSDSLLGGDDSDHLDGGDGDDRLYGGAGNDSLLGGDGNDRLEGDDGDDLLYGEEGNDGLIGGDGNDRLEGNSGDDVLLGRAGDDHLEGEDGNDILEGGDGDDVLLGGDGDDLLEGGVGDDHLDGGAGNDGFIFGPSFGNDTIINFEGGLGAGDNIRLDPSLFEGGPANFDAVLVRAIDDGAGNVIIRFDANARLTLTGITKAQLAADDFSFA
ncbi:MAG TPA: Ig-like domain-containing protein [Microvirga sp.]|nr:Ig-like domain-containing protein [Microvirga sp.]